MNKLTKNIRSLLFPILLGGFFLFWIYQDFDFNIAREILTNGVNWWWMTASLVFGVTGHIFRGLRWVQTLTPLGYTPRKRNAIYAIFLSYAANLVIPRVGEVSRCGVMKKYDNIAFSKSLGTVVTERIIDMLSMGMITTATILFELTIFIRFFAETGTKIPSVTYLLQSVWFYILLTCLIAVAVMVYKLVKSLEIYKKAMGIMYNIKEGILSLKRVRNISLYIIYTLLIWGSYFLHFYLCFLCFDFSTHLGISAGMVMFVAGTIAVIVPTPNGAGPWHFAIITMMMLYGVSAEDASAFALIIHGIQTLLVVALGIFAWSMLKQEKQRQ